MAMAVRIALMAPVDLSEMMAGVAGQIDGVELVLDVYDDPRESVELYRRHRSRTDAIVFGGPIAHSHLVEALSEAEEPAQVPLLYVPYNEVAIYRALFTMARERPPTPGDELGISIDHPASRDIQECLAEVELGVSRAFARECSSPEDTVDLVSFHRDLWEAGKVSAILTSVFYVYTRLGAIGAPVYRIYPAKSAVRDAIRNAVAAVEQLKQTQRQAAVVMISFGGAGDAGEASGAAYTLHKRRLALEQFLRAFAQQVEGVFHWTGQTELALVTSRGHLEQPANVGSCADLLRDVSDDIGVAGRAGIGFGRTVREASSLAEDALREARTGRSGSVLQIDAEGTVTRSGHHLKTLSYSASCSEPSLIAASERAGIGVGTLGKILALANNAEQGHLTAAGVARNLDITRRSARRLLDALARAELAEECGKEQIGTRGRPRRLFRLVPLTGARPEGSEDF